MVSVCGGGHSYSWGCEKELGCGSWLGSQTTVRVRVRSMEEIIRAIRVGIRIMVMDRVRISLYKNICNYENKSEAKKKIFKS